jgi:hypothetical protein
MASCTLEWSAPHGKGEGHGGSLASMLRKGGKGGKMVGRRSDSQKEMARVGSGQGRRVPGGGAREGSGRPTTARRSGGGRRSGGARAGEGV